MKGITGVSAITSSIFTLLESGFLWLLLIPVFSHAQTIYICKLLILDHVCAGKILKAVFGSYNRQHNLWHYRSFSGQNSGYVSRIYPFLKVLFRPLHDFYLLAAQSRTQTTQTRKEKKIPSAPRTFECDNRHVLLLIYSV